MLEILVKPVTNLTAEEDAQADETDHLAFSAPGAGVEEKDIVWSNPEWLAMGKLDGRVVSVVCLLYREIRVGDQLVPVAGVGGVATHPDFQRRGLAAAVLERARDYMRDEMKVPFGLLVCSHTRAPYYAKLGWQLISDPMVFDSPTGKRGFGELTMILPLSGQPWPTGLVDLCGNPW